MKKHILKRGGACSLVGVLVSCFLLANISLLCSVSVPLSLSSLCL